MQTPPQPPAPLDWGTVAQWASAVATLFAVGYALYRDSFLVWWRRPRLRLVAAPVPPHCHKIPMRSPLADFAANIPSIDSYYLRLWVENFGRTRANNAQVFISGLHRKTGTTFKAVSNFLPMNLQWSHDHQIYLEGISPGMGRHCDLAHIIDPNRRNIVSNEDKPGSDPSRTLGSLDLEVKPTSLNYLLDPDTYRLDLKVAAANCQPVPVTIELTITGLWFDDEHDMLTRGIDLKTVSD